MTRKYILIGVGLAAISSLSLVGSCKDTKALQENEQLKAQVLEPRKRTVNWETTETVTAARDELTKENETLEAKLNPRNRNTQKQNESAVKLRIITFTDCVSIWKR